MDAALVDEDMFAEGVAFDGSSIAGWKAINESDMMLILDPESAHMDPFFAQSTMAVFCDIVDPITGEGLQPRPAHDRQEGRSLRQVRRFRRHRVSSARKLNSSCSTTFVSTPTRTTPASSWTAPNCRPTWVPNTKPATSATVRARRVVTSRSRRSTALRTSVPKCCPS